MSTPAPQPVLVPVAVLGALDRDRLAAALRPLFEDAGPLVERLAGRSFTRWAEVLDAADAAVAAMGEGERAALLRAHPRIGGSLSELRRRSSLSYAEQGGDSAETGADVLARLDQLNDAYEERFGFPFVEFVAGRPRSAIIPVLEFRLERDPDVELTAGCGALVAIARDRLTRLDPGPEDG